MKERIAEGQRRRKLKRKLKRKRAREAGRWRRNWICLQYCRPAEGLLLS